MDISTAISKAREHTAIVQRMEFALLSDPSNPKLALGLGSAKRRARRSQELLERFAENQQIDLIRYRLVHGNEVYAAEAVAESVLTFQHSFTGAADYLKHGAKSKGRFSKEIEAKTRLNFAYTYPGSLGMVLAVENDRDLLDGGELDGVVDVFAQFLAVSDQDDAIGASRQLGAALVTQMCRWVDVNAKWETSIDFVVKRGSGIERGEHVSKNQFIDLSDIFHTAKDEEPHTFSVDGMLVGLDLDDRRFHFVVPDGDDFKGSLSDDFFTTPTTVGRRYRATINETVKRIVATGKETRTLNLLSLEPLGQF